MNVKPNEKKVGTGNSEKLIGYWCGPLLKINPSLSELKELYGFPDKEDEKEPVYIGETKDGNGWSRLLFIFIDEISKKPIEYSLFISDKLAEFEKDGVTKSWWINQHGQSQLVDKEENLFRSFTHMQKQNDAKEWEDVMDNNNEPVKLIYRQAYGGETSLYKLLRMLVTQDWFQADAETNLFVKHAHIMRSVVKDITMYIGTETFQSVVGMMYVEAKDTENGIQYNNNCIDGAWLPGWKIKDVNVNTQSNSWNRLDVRPKGKGSYKLKDMYEFYQSCKRCRYMWELTPLHKFEADKHIAAGDQKFVAANDNETTSEPNDISY